MTDKAILENLFLFRDAREALASLALPPAETFRRGQVIYGGRSFRRALGVVLRGRAEALSGQKPELTTFSAGSVFGAAALFGGGEEYVSCVRAVTDCRVQFLPEDALRELFRTHPQTALNYVGFLTDRVRFLNGRIAAFTAGSATERLYRWLRANCDGAGRLPAVPMSKLAKQLNMGRTSVYRALDDLEKQQLIRKEEGEVIVC